MSQKPQVNNFKGIKHTCQLNEDLIKNYNKKSDEGYFLKVMFNILKNYMNLIIIYHFYQK